MVGLHGCDFGCFSCGDCVVRVNPYFNLEKPRHDYYMNAQQQHIYELAQEDAGVHFDDMPKTLEDACERLVALAYDALAAIDKLKEAS